MFKKCNHQVSLHALTPYSIVDDWIPVAKNLTRVDWSPITIAYSPVSLKQSPNVNVAPSITRWGPDVSVDEEDAPEANVASLCSVQLLQCQIREKSCSWKMSPIESSNLWIFESLSLWVFEGSPKRKNESTLTHSLTTTANAPLLVNPLVGSNNAL